jgi:hypothetical protein
LNEPILHAAALVLLHENSESVLQYVRDHFSRADLGWSGEFAAQIVCLLAAKKPQFYSGGVHGDASWLNQSLVEFLQRLLCNASLFSHTTVANKQTTVHFDDSFLQGILDAAQRRNLINSKIESQINSYLPNAEIRLLSFVRLQRPPLQADLKLYFLFGRAFVCQRNNESSDLGIIVRYKRTAVSDFEYTVVLIQVRNVAGSFSSAHCLRTIDEIQLQHTFRKNASAPVMPFGPTSRNFDGIYPQPANNLILPDKFIRMLFKMRKSPAELNNVTGVYCPFFGINKGHFFGVVRGLADLGHLDPAVIQSIDDIVADNERFFHHEMPDNEIFSIFRCSYDLCDAQNTAKHDAKSQSRSKLMKVVASLKYPQSQSNQQLLVSDRPHPMFGPFMNAFNLYRSRQVCNDTHVVFGAR